MHIPHSEGSDAFNYIRGSSYAKSVYCFKKRIFPPDLTRMYALLYITYKTGICPVSDMFGVG